MLLNCIALICLLINALFFARGCFITLLVAVSLSIVVVVSSHCWLLFHCQLFRCIVGWCSFVLLVVVSSCC